MFSSAILEQHHATLCVFHKNQFLFHEDQHAREFFQIETGAVKLYTLNDDGREFIQGIFNAGECFGAPALIGKYAYAASAVAVKESKIWKIPEKVFSEMLKGSFDQHLKIDQELCKRIRYKLTVLSEISLYEPEHRINTLLQYLKEKLKGAGLNGKIIMPYTREQLAGMSGLSLGTVIRTVRKMARDGKLVLEGHKISF